MRYVAVAALVIGALGLTTWRFTRPDEPVLDANRVMVYPLLVPTDFRGSRNVGEDIGTMIGTALDGAGDLRWIDGWTLLSPGVRQNIRNLAAADARALARSKRAAWYVGGRIVMRGDSSEVFLELNDVAGDSTVARGHAVGLTADAWRTGLNAVNTLLPALIQSGAGDVDILAEWKDRNPAAVASYLLAEGAFRRVHLAEALAHYRDALEADSTFALAAIRGAQAATWNHRSDEAASFIQLATRQKLSPRYEYFARGYSAYLAGAADSAAAQFRRAIAVDPEMSVAWMQLGESYMHLLPFAGNTDSLARKAFDEAYRLDPGAKHLLFHSIELRLRDGDTESAESMLREFVATRPDSLLSEQVRLMYQCVKDGPRSVQWMRAARVAPLAVISAANSLKGGGGHLECAVPAFEAVRALDTTTAGAGRRWVATVGLASARLAQNRPADAIAGIDNSIARGWGGGSFYLMAAPLYPSLRPRAAEIAQKDEATYGQNYSQCPYTVRLWQLGVFEALAGRREVADAVAENLEAKARASGTQADGRLARSVRAFATLARGDSAAAMALLRSLVSDPAPGGDLAWDLAAPRGMERLTLARLLLAERDYQTAIEVANVFDAAWPSVYLLYLPASLELRAEAASAIPSTQLAARFRSRLAAFRGERGAPVR
jgi:tetratricopeptide (TPR) repeat protein